MADRLDAAFLADLAAFAGAVAAGDGVVLEDVSGRLERAGALRDAAEAAAAAAAAHEEAGYRRAATDCRARAARLFRDCGVDPTRVGSASPMPTLTLREEEVALLALSGQSNQTIADRLVVSVRTVEAHLSHVYAKFGINNRAELAFALEAATRTSPPHQPLPH
jgi:DNA-binding CsgD family transcriptional regulator